MQNEIYTPFDNKSGYINSWYVFQVRTGDENKACAALKRQCERFDIEMEFVVPLAVKFLKKRKERIKSHKTVFPGYVFANGKIDTDTYYKLKGIPSVYKLLRDRSSNEFLPIPRDEMELLAKLMNVHGVIEQSVIKFEQGRIATIIEGPMASYKGEIVNIDKHKNKLTLLIPFLGQERRVEVGFLFAEMMEDK